MRRAKIVATLGPATGTPDRIAALIEGGANVIRVNASHGTAETRGRWIEVVRRAADGAGVPVAVLVDLQGPRIRVGELASSRVLRPGAVVVFAPQELATGDEIPTTYADLARDARPGARILLNDGLLAVEVTEVAPPRVRALVVDGGALGVELPFEEVPIVQKRLIREANRRGKPVITATQMLESMVNHPRPTRAEASDVANAILDGTDAVMLSAETATGEYPLEAGRAMDRIIRETERQSSGAAREGRRMGEQEEGSVEDAIAIGTHAVARMLRPPLIVTLTKGGFTARKVAALRPPVPILAVTTEASTLRQLALVWGVAPVVVDHVPGYDAMLEVVRDLILKRGLARPGDRIVMTAGVPWEVSGTTNLLKVEVV